MKRIQPSHLNSSRSTTSPSDSLSLLPMALAAACPHAATAPQTEAATRQRAIIQNTARDPSPENRWSATAGRAFHRGTSRAIFNLSVPCPNSPTRLLGFGWKVRFFRRSDFRALEMLCHPDESFHPFSSRSSLVTPRNHILKPQRGNKMIAQGRRKERSAERLPWVIAKKLFPLFIRWRGDQGVRPLVLSTSPPLLKQWTRPHAPPKTEPRRVSERPSKTLPRGTISETGWSVT
jgi:hypothetical protein